jgi:hypothetical protein
MSPRRRQNDGVEESLLRASPQNEVETLDATISGLAALDADQLLLQWRNRLDGRAPAHLPRWLLLKVLAYRLQAVALGDLDKTTVRSIRASQGDAIDFDGGPFKKRQPRTRDGIRLSSFLASVFPNVRLLSLGFGDLYGSRMIPGALPLDPRPQRLPFLETVRSLYLLRFPKLFRQLREP